MGPTTIGRAVGCMRDNQSTNIKSNIKYIKSTIEHEKGGGKAFVFVIFLRRTFFFFFSRFKTFFFFFSQMSNLERKEDMK